MTKDKKKSRTVDQRQLDLFGFFLPEKDNNHFSQTIEGMVCAPRFMRGKSQTIPLSEAGQKGKDKSVVVREYMDRDRKQRITIKPTIMDVKKKIDGKFVEVECLVYPGSDVELIEDMLLKMAVEGRGIIGEDKEGAKTFGIFFTIRELRRRLELRNYTRSHKEILNALTLGAECVEELDFDFGPGGRHKIKQPIFSTFIESKRNTDNDDANNEDGTFYIGFHPMFVKCIESKTFRRINHLLHMRLKLPLARWLNKTLNHYFLNAAADQTFKIKLSEISERYGLPSYSRVRKGHELVEAALKEMEREDNVVLRKHNSEPYYSKTDGRVLVDYEYELYPSDQFISEMIRSNVFHRDYFRISKPGDRAIPIEMIKEISEPIKDEHDSAEENINQAAK